MRATDWEFKNRALIFGLIFGCTFPLYSIDHQNSTAALANWLASRFAFNADNVAHLLFAIAALLLVIGAFVRTWASSYLRAAVVYAAEVKTESLVAEGPYRRVRNPLYFANILMGFGMGAMMSRVGFVVAAVTTIVFCYRLILREEQDLRAELGASYERYSSAVPRLWPSLAPRIPDSGRQASWTAGLTAELWYWGFAASVTAFAITFSLKLFFVILAASIGLLWAMSMLVQKRGKSQAASSTAK